MSPKIVKHENSLNLIVTNYRISLCYIDGQFECRNRKDGSVDAILLFSKRESHNAPFANEMR